VINKKNNDMKIAITIGFFVITTIFFTFPISCRAATDSNPLAGFSLTGENTDNYILPQGWSARCTQDFENANTFDPHISWALGRCKTGDIGTGMSVNTHMRQSTSTNISYRGSFSAETYINNQNSGGDWSLSFPAQAKEIYLSWYERRDAFPQNKGFYMDGGDLFVARFKGQSGDLLLNFCCSDSPGEPARGNNHAYLFWQPESIFNMPSLTNLGDVPTDFDGSWHQWEVFYHPNTQTNGSPNSDGMLEILHDGNVWARYLNTNLNGESVMTPIYIGINGVETITLNLTNATHEYSTCTRDGNGKCINDTDYTSCEYLESHPSEAVCAGSPARGPSWGCADQGLSFQALNNICPGTAPTTGFHRNIDDVIMLYKTESVSPDIQAPTVPTNLIATAISSSQINLSWTASTDAVGVAGYRIYRGGVQIATSTGVSTTYSNTGLAASTQYSYQVSAFDAAKNFSIQSASASATTQSGPANSALSLINTGSGVDQTVTIESTGQFRLVFEAADNWGLSQWYDLADDPDALHNLETNEYSYPFDGFSSIFYEAGLYQQVWYGTTPDDPKLYMNTVRHAPNASARSFEILENNPNRIVVRAMSSPVIDESALNNIVGAVTYYIYPNGKIYVHAETTATNNQIADHLYNPVVALADPSYLAPTTGQQDRTTIASCNGLTLTDTTKSWTPNQWVGYKLNQPSYHYWNIISNTANTLTLSANGGSNPTNTWYYITSRDDTYGWIMSTDTQSPYEYQQEKAKYLYVYWDPTTPAPWTNWTKASILLVPSTNNPSDYDGIQSRHYWNGWKRFLFLKFNIVINAGQTVTQDFLIQLGAKNSAILPDLANSAMRNPIANGYLADPTPPAIFFDVQSPTVPASLTATKVSGKEVNLSWVTSTDNVGVVGYKIYRGATQIATTTGATYVDTTGNPATAYSYKVAAFDAARNVSAQSTALAVTTGHEYYIDPVNGNNDATGLSTSAAWKDFRNIFSYRGDKVSALSYKSHLATLSGGDIVYVMDGTINTLYRPGDDSGAAGLFGTAGVTGNPSILYFRGVNGTVIASIKIAAYSGAHPILDPQYNGEGFSVLQSSYLDFSGIVIKNSMTAGEGGGIGIESVNNIKVHDVEVYDTDGVDNANMSGLHCLSSTNVEIYNSIFHDNYDRTAADTGGITTPNSTNLVFFGGGNISVHDNLIYQTPQPLGTVNSGAGIKYKAASADINAYFKIYNNVFRNCKFFSIESGTGNTSVQNNIIIGGNTGVVFDDPANYTRLMNEVVENNTFYNLKYSNNSAYTEAALSFYPTLYWNTRGYPGSISNIVFRNNIIYDTGSYAAEHTPVYMYGYIDDTLYNASMPELHVNNNCYYNSTGNPLLFSLAYATSYGALGGTYNWAQWRALTWTNPANNQTQALNFDVNSVNANPLFITIDTNLSLYNPSSNAFRPAPGSLAINMGAYAGLPASTSTPSDTTPPTGSVSINSGASYTNNVSTILTLLASDISGVTQMKLSDISTNFSSLTALAFSSPYSWTLLGVDGVKTAYAWFSDSLGNWNNTPFSDTIILDRLSPDITNISVSNISTNSATLTWNTSELAQANIDYGLTSGYGQSTTEETAPVTTHSAILSSLSSATTYNFRINATDRAGNQSVSINQTFRTATTSIPDTIPPAKIADLSANNILSSSADLHWTATGDDNHTGLAKSYIIKYSTTAINSSSTPTQINNWWNSAIAISQTLIPKLSGQSETFTILNLNLSTAYYFAIQAQDEVNNTSTISNILNISTPAAPVVVPPVTPPSNGGGGGGGGSSGGSSGSITNTANSTEAPTHFLVIGAKNQVFLSWSNPINTNFVGVKLFRKLNSAITSQTDPQGKLIYQGTGEQYNDLNIPTSSQYYYTIYSYDRSSHYSNPVTVSATLDQTKQTIAIPKTEPPLSNGVPSASEAGGVSSGGDSGGRNSLVGVKSSEVEIITKSESDNLVQNSRSILFSAVTMKIYQKVIALATKEQTQQNKYNIANFIHNGTPTTIVTGAGERGGSIASFRNAFGRLPETTTDWQDVIKIANGRWPSQRNISAEAKVQGNTFAKIYGRTANLKNTNDSNAVTVMTYGLRPATRSTESEKAAIKAFRYFFRADPTTAADWDVVRAIAYSGAKR
jgi:chitodextrinase